MLIKILANSIQLNGLRSVRCVCASHFDPQVRAPRPYSVRGLEGHTSSVTESSSKSESVSIVERCDDHRRTMARGFLVLGLFECISSPFPLHFGGTRLISDSSSFTNNMVIDWMSICNVPPVRL